MPAGFGTLDPLTQTVPANADTASWTITVAEDILPIAGAATQSVVRNSESSSGVSIARGTATAKTTGDELKADIFMLDVTVTGVDSTGGDAQVNNMFQQSVTVVERATLTMNSQITTPSGATDNTISTFQPFDVQLWVENTGEANVPTSSLSDVKLIVPAAFAIEGSAGDTLDLTLQTGLAAAQTRRIFAPADKPLSLENIQTQIETAAIDENTGQEAFLAQANAPLNVSVVNRASLQIDTVFTSLDVVGRDQPFIVSSRITNTGDANLSPDSVFVHLDFDDTAFQLVAVTDTQRIELVNKSATVSWQLQALPTAQLNTKYGLAVSIDSTRSQDENNNDPSQPIFVETPEVADSIDVVDIGSVLISEAYINQPGIISDTVSTQQTISIVVLPQITGDFINQAATLDLPGGFANDTLTAPITQDTIRWNVIVPEINPSGNTDTLKIRIQATSNRLQSPSCSQ